MVRKSRALPGCGPKNRISQTALRVRLTFYFKMSCLWETGGMNHTKVGEGSAARRTLLKMSLHEFPFRFLNFARGG